MINKKTQIWLIFSILISGCTTMHFDNGLLSQKSSKLDRITSEKWHHNFFFDSWEISDSVNLNNECIESEWESIKTETSFLNAISRIPLEILKIPLWYPRTVTIICK